MKYKKILAAAMVGCLVISSSNQIVAEGRLKRAIAGSFLGSIAGGAVGFGIGVASVATIGACCPCCIIIPVIGYSILGIGTGAATGGVVGTVTAKDSENISKKRKEKKNRYQKR